MMNTKLITWLSVFMLLLAFPLFGQAYKQVESEYMGLYKELASEQAVLDSLNMELENRANEITQNKVERVTKQRVKSLLSESVPLTTQIQQQQASVRDLSTKVAAQRIHLSVAYEAALDSLAAVDDGALDAAAAEALRVEIIRCSRNYLLLSPALSPLSFHPEIVRAISPLDSGDSLDNAIQRTYIMEASMEVGDHLSRITDQKEELTASILLAEKAERFLEDIEGDPLYSAEFNGFANNGTFDEGDRDATTLSDLDNSPPETEFSNALLNSFSQEYLVLLEQLEVDESRARLESETLQQAMSIEDYVSLLEATERRLRVYEKLLNEKLENFR